MNWIILLVGVVIIAIYCSPLVKSKVNIGNIFGIILGSIICFIGIFYDIFVQLLNNKSFVLLMILVGIFILAHYITFMIIVLFARKTATTQNTIIVLGCRVKGDKPSKALLHRCEAAYKYLLGNEKAIAVLSGGQGSDELIAESECMKSILTDKGIGDGRLYIENKSTSTYENLVYSMKIIDENNLSKDVAIVTSEYHILRSLMIAKELKINAKAIPSKTANTLRIPYFSREVFGIWWQILKRCVKK